MVLVVEVLMENMSILMMKVIVYTVVLLLMDRAVAVLMGSMNMAMAQTNVFFVDQPLMVLVVAVLMGNTRNNCKNQYLE